MHAAIAEAACAYIHERHNGILHVYTFLWGDIFSGGGTKSASETRPPGQIPLAEFVRWGQNPLADSVRGTKSASGICPGGQFMGGTESAMTPAL